MSNDPFTPAAVPEVVLETGIGVSAVDLDGDGVEDILTGKGRGTRAYFRGYRIARYDAPTKAVVGIELEQILRQRVYDEQYGYGVYVGG